MAKRSLASMSVDTLLKLRDDIAAALQRRANDLKKELRSIGRDYRAVGHIALYGRKGKTAAPKYRDPATGETWSGRGAPARWIAAYEKQGKKREAFLIGKSTATAKRAKKKRAAKK